MIRSGAVRMPFDPFLLPVCECGGATVLVRREPIASEPGRELKVYRCTICGAMHGETGARTASSLTADSRGA